MIFLFNIFFEQLGLQRNSSLSKRGVRREREKKREGSFVEANFKIHCKEQISESGARHQHQEKEKKKRGMTEEGSSPPLPSK